MRRSQITCVLKPFGVLLLGGLLATQLGCYRRVVGVKNAPGYHGPVYEANVSEGNEDLFTSKTVTPTQPHYLD